MGTMLTMGTMVGREEGRGEELEMEKRGRGGE
jgi:hypothetical protein